MTDEEWENLYSNYDTSALLRAVDSIDELRGLLGDGSDLKPPEIRDDLLKLHGLAMDVVNPGQGGALTRIAILALDLQDQTDDMLELLQKVNQTVGKLVDLLPESAFDPDE